MSEPIKAAVVFGSVLVVAAALWLAITAFVAWQWPIQFWTWDAAGRGAYVIMTVSYIGLVLMGAALVAAESVEL